MRPSSRATLLFATDEKLKTVRQQFGKLDYETIGSLTTKAFAQTIIEAPSAKEDSTTSKRF